MYWQYLIVALIILSAVAYIGRGVWRKAAAVAGKKSGKDCDTGCGKCGN
jgi:hypothetical protein